MAEVGIIMGSKSDLAVMQNAIDILIDTFYVFENQKREIVHKFIKIEIEFQKNENNSYTNFK